MKKLKNLLIILAFFPINVLAATFGFNGVYPETRGCQQSPGVRPTLKGETGICNRYAVDGETAACIDPLAPNPPDGAFLNETIITATGDSWGKGLIALTNAGIKNNLSDFNLTDAYRIYSVQSGNTVMGHADVSGIGSFSNYSSPVGQAVKVGLCAFNGSNCDGVNLSDYLPASAIPSGSGGESGAIKVRKTNQDVSTNGNNITAVADVSIESGADNIQVSECYSEGFNCRVKNQSGTNFQVEITGKKGNKQTAKVCMSMGGNSGDLVTELKLYVSPSSQYQRFVKLNSTAGENSEDCIEIKLPSICDDPNLSPEELLKAGCCDSIDPSGFEEDSKEEEMYIDACGPIVVIENDCGADSCNDSSYKDFTHSYVRQKTMRSIMRDLDNGKSGSLDDYLDRPVNDYCGVYVTEKVDTLMPATATSVSGQFFIFDKYNDLNCTTETSCLRQPYISGKVKATFFTDYKKWKAAYESAKSAEVSTFNSWQSAVDAVGPAYWAMKEAEADVNDCRGTDSNISSAPDKCKEWIVTGYDDKGNEKGHYESIFGELVAELDSAKNDYESAKENEASRQDSYRVAVGRRMGLQDAKDTCANEEKEFKSDFEYDFSPKLQFLYSQTSQTYGTKEYSMDMVSNTSSIKYWPNITTASMSNVDYLGVNSINLDPDTATNPNIQNLEDEYERTGEYLIYDGDKPSKVPYKFPDNTHDSCSGEHCTLYKYNTQSFTSIKTVSDVDDPYNKISSPEEISKIIFYRPDQNTFALMNSGEYKTINYEANDVVTNVNGLEVGYVYNLELTAFKGQYTTNFKMSNVGFRGSEGGGFTQKLINDYISEKGYETFESVCNYCNEEMAFKRFCPECDPEDPGEFEPQFYYRTISLSDVTPNDREDGKTNWSDDKGKAAERSIQAVSGTVAKVDLGNEYLALASPLDQKDEEVLDTTYLADVNDYYDIYDDESRYFLEYEINLTSKDMQIIKKNSAQASFDYTTMRMCNGSPDTRKDVDTEYCFTCNSDMKECESSFVTAFFSDKTDLITTRNSKWKYYVNGAFCKGSIDSCLDGKYPDPTFVKSYIAKYKNWP